MKTIVLAAEDSRGLDGDMAEHFGRCPFYVVTRVSGEQEVEAAEVRANPYYPQHEPGQVPQFIHSLGADVVIASGMGHRAIRWFEQLGVQAVTGSRGQVRATLQAYLNGEIHGAAGCSHDHDHDHGHDHGHD
jgi:predicted Fe-Mo cluster-binding NifX family protein